MNVYTLDPKVEVARDYSGAIVLIPNDRRSVVRLSSVHSDVIERLKNGVSFSTDNDNGNFSYKEFCELINELDRYELLEGRRRSSNRGLYHFPSLIKYINTLAAICSWPLRKVIPVSKLSLFYWMIMFLTFFGLISLWIHTNGKLFSYAFGSSWWIGYLSYILVFPLLHEFGHAFAANSFGFKAERIGIDIRSPLQWRPFIGFNRLLLTDNADARFWIPTAGVLTNSILALTSSIILVKSDPDNYLYAAFGTFTIFMHLRIIIDAGIGKHTDATKSLQLIRSHVSRCNYILYSSFVRFIFYISVVSFLLLIVISIKYKIGEF